MAERPKRGRSETRANDFPANVSVLLNDGSEIDFQNDYTGHGAVREAISSRATVLVLVVVVVVVIAKRQLRLSDFYSIRARNSIVFTDY